MQHNTYKNALNNKATPQSEAIPGKNMVKNNAGGYVFELDKFKQLERFLILGTTGGTYYVEEKPLTKENAAIVLECLKENSVDTLNMILDISDNGRAVSNESALFALAIACTYKDSATMAMEMLPKIARTGTHLFHFVQYLDSMRGWGRCVRNGIGKWYTNKSVSDLAFQVAKYKQRDGWSHKDVLRLSHAKPIGKEQEDIFSYLVGKTEEVPQIGLLKTMDALSKAQTEAEVISIIKEAGNAVMEILPSQWKNKPKVQEALLPTLGMTALVRNLGNFGASGLLVKGNWDVISIILEHLSDERAIKKSRIHPMQAILAYITYGSGHGNKGNNSWEVVPQVLDALQDLVYKSFSNVESTNKKYYLALDVSGSMGWSMAGNTELSCAKASAVMAMAIARSEKNYIINGFADGLRPLKITAKTTLNEAFREVAASNFGGTDCSLPMLDALQKNIYVDTFVVITDNETWAGRTHPVQALREYQNKINKNAKLVVIGMTSTGFSIADPSCPEMLDVVGFDTSTPNIIAEFSSM